MGQRVGDITGEALAVDRQCTPGSYPVFIGRAHDQRVKTPHLFLQKADGVGQFVAAQGVGAHQLGKVSRMMRRGKAFGPHLKKADRNAASRKLPGTLAAGKTCADHRNDWILHACSPFPQDSSLGFFDAVFFAVLFFAAVFFAVVFFAADLAVFFVFASESADAAVSFFG